MIGKTKPYFMFFFFFFFNVLKVPIAANCKDVCLQNTSKSPSYNMAIIMTFWIGNGPVLKISSE